MMMEARVGVWLALGQHLRSSNPHAAPSTSSAGGLPFLVFTSSNSNQQILRLKHCDRRTQPQTVVCFSRTNSEEDYPPPLLLDYYMAAFLTASTLTNLSFYHHRLLRCRRADQPWAETPALRLRIRLPTARLFPLVRANGDGAAAESNHSSSALPPEAAIDIKLPRRNLLVEFTCDSCGERTKRLINRVAYEKGTIFLQCAGCLAYHKFVDNLSLVVEYDLRQELDVDSDVT